jgi:hypothetical protein
MLYVFTIFINFKIKKNHFSEKLVPQNQNYEMEHIIIQATIALPYFFNNIQKVIFNKLSAYLYTPSLSKPISYVPISLLDL